MKRIIAAALFAAIVQSAASAAPVYEQTYAPGGDDWCSPCGSSFRGFASFTLGTGATVGSVDFYTSDFTTATNVDVSIWNSTRTTQLFGTTTVRGPLGPAVGPSEFLVSLSLPNWSIGAGNYWLSIYGLNGGLTWVGASSGNDVQLSGANPQSSVFGGRTFYFRLNGANEVPEPAALGLLGLGVLGVAAGRRRKAG